MCPPTSMFWRLESEAGDWRLETGDWRLVRQRLEIDFPSLWPPVSSLWSCQPHPEDETP